MKKLQKKVTLTINAHELIHPVEDSREVKFIAMIEVNHHSWLVDISIPITAGGEQQMWDAFKSSMEG